jgi:uncharacterized membrane protein (DUF106 family)
MVKLVVQGAISELIYVYITLAIAAPLLVGIVSPLTSSVISRLEEKRFERFKKLKRKIKDLAKAKDPTEYERIKEEKEEAEEEYETAKDTAKYFDYSIVFGLIVSGFSIFGVLNLFETIPLKYSGELVASIDTYVVLTLLLFFLEVVFLLVLVLYYIRSEREETIKGLLT